MIISGIMRLMATAVLSLVLLFQSQGVFEALPRETLPQGAQPNIEPHLIAHAGGAVYGMRLTNSLQALDSSYSKGFRFFELDIDWTRDHIPVLIHDWGNVNWYVDIRHSTEPQTFNDFMLKKPIRDLQFMDLASLDAWCSQHGDASVITDIKSDNIILLGIIKEKYPHIYSAAIPQIYSFDEYDPVKYLGYQDILLSLYRLDAADGDVLGFCSSHSLFGVSLHDAGLDHDFLQELNSIGVRTFIHPVNEYNQYVKLREDGAYGVFTDFLEPGGWVE